MAWKILEFKNLENFRWASAQRTMRFDPLRLSSAAIVRSSSAEFEILKIVLRVSVANAVPRQLHSAEDVEV